MIPLTHRQGQRLAVFGLGKTGATTVAALVAGGAEALAWDDSESARARAAAAGATLAEPHAVDWATIDALVLSPGVPLTHPEPHPVVKLARGNGVPVIGDTELFVEALHAAPGKARLVAVTGTNGKSTTVALISHLLSASGFNVEVGGNIGTKAVLELSPPVNHVVYVIEFSSYQIDLTPHLKPDVAVFLNLSPDHLDRHGDMAGYAAAKSGIFARQRRGDVVVLGQDDPMTAAMRARIDSAVRVIPISRDRVQPGGVWADGTVLIDGTAGQAEPIADLAGIGSLRGLHNRQNAAAAAAALLGLGVSHGVFSPAYADFAGLAHRMEEVARSGRVLLVNDSKATNAEAAEKALVSFNDIFWIAGGRAKEGGIEPLAPHFGRIARAYLVGEAAASFAATLTRHGVDHELSGTLDRAVEAAFRDAMASAGREPVVLLSPACASFDQFANFEARGDVFRAAARRLAGAADGETRA